MTWKSMKIGTKLTLGCGGVLLMLAVMASYNYVSLREIGRVGHEALAKAQQEEFLLEKEIDHLKWVGKVNDLFLKKDVTSLQVETDDHQCGLGKWLYGEDAKEIAARDEELASLLDSIKEPHRKLHESAVKIGKAYVAVDPSLEDLLAERWIDHLAWVKELEASMLTGTEFKGGLDPHACAFGRWFYSYEAADPNLQELLKQWEQPHAGLHESARKIVEAMGQGDQELARKIYREETLPALDKLDSSYKKTMGWVHEATGRQTAAKDIFDRETSAAALGTQQILDKMRKYLDRRSKTGTHRMEDEIGNNMALVSILSILAFILGIPAAVILIRSITKPLGTIIENLNEGAQQVVSVAGQVSASSQSLAEGASQQAASIEETSSSLEEMSSMTRQNAKSAEKANAIMKGADQVVGRAGGSMAELISFMEDISRASEETSKIVKSIDEIAFQTNLLALNAAVEAARAGEAGAGFAVVADEVRNLAIRAGEAAKNTADLIEGTVKKIKDGSELASKTSEAFTQVAKSAAKVGGLVAEIAAASNEQAQGIEQANEGVAEMDRVVQQNAAHAEESAGASEEMNAQAEQMKAIVSELTMMAGAKRAANRDEKASTQPEKIEPVINHSLPAPNGKTQERAPVAHRGREVTPPEVIPMDDEEFKDF